MAAHPLKTDPSEEKMMAVLNSLAKAEEWILTRLTSAAWNIAYTALWNGIQFSPREKQKAKKLIRELLLHSTAVELSFEEFVQRVLLTRQYLPPWRVLNCKQNTTVGVFLPPVVLGFPKQPGQVQLGKSIIDSPIAVVPFLYTC